MRRWYNPAYTAWRWSHHGTRVLRVRAVGLAPHRRQAGRDQRHARAGGARAQSYEAIGRGPGASDPMRPVDARIDAEADALAELAQCEREVESARAVCRGVRAACPHNPVWGDVLELRYIELFEWDRIGRALGMTGSGARQACSAALDWVDSVGIAAAREGCGQAALQ